MKNIGVVGLAFLTFVGTLFLENAFIRTEEVITRGQVLVEVPAGQQIQLSRKNSPQNIQGSNEVALEAGDSIDTQNANGVTVKFSDHGVIRLASASSLSLLLNDSATDGYIFKLLSGRAWFNALLTPGILNIMAGGAYLIPRYAVADVSVDKDKALVYANRHQVEVGLVPLNFVPKNAKEFPDSDFINNYLLSQGNQTTVYTDKIVKDEPTLRKLFYSKLVKEFPIGLIDPATLISDAWLKTNIGLDTSLARSIADNVQQGIRNRGLKVTSFDSFIYNCSQAIKRIANLCTFSSEKVMSRMLDDLFDDFHDSEYLLIFGRNAEVKDRISFFQKYLRDTVASEGDPIRPMLLDRLRHEYNSLAYVNEDDPLYAVKSVLQEQLLEQLDHSDNDIREKFFLVRGIMNGVFDLAVANPQLARQALEDYYNHFDVLVTQEKTRLKNVEIFLAEENQIMDSLFIQYSQFYRDRYFAMKNRLEQEWLALIPEGENKNEEKQTMISNKIDFLHQLKTYFLADKVAVDDAKQIVFRLFREADDLKLPAENQVAVNDIYNQRLADFGVFFRYLNSPEYVATTLHGASHQDQFSQFIQAQQEQVSINEIRQEIIGGQTQQVLTVQQILEQARTDFSAAGVTNLSFGAFTGPEQKYIPVVSAIVSNTGFQATYDWDQKLVSQIVATNGSVISQEPVKLENLTHLIQTLTAPQPVAQVTQPQPSQPVPVVSKTELVAKVLLLQKLKGNDVAVPQDQITIVDIRKSLFSVQQATLVSDQSITFRFDVDGKNNVVSNLVVKTQTGDRSYDGTLSLSDLSVQVKTIYQAGKTKP